MAGPDEQKTAKKKFIDLKKKKGNFICGLIF